MTPTEALAQAVMMPKVAMTGFPFFAGAETYADAILAALPPGWRLVGPDNATVTTPSSSAALVVMSPIVDGLCSGCGTKPTRETGSCRCRPRILAALSADKEGQK